MPASELTFVCDTYKGCHISALALYDNWNSEWIGKAHLFWKRRNEKHLATVTSAERFYNSEDAEKHALGLAHGWVDEHFMDDPRTPAPRR